MKPEELIVENIIGKLYGYDSGPKANQLKFIAEYKIARKENIFDLIGVDKLPSFMENRKIFDHYHLFSTTDYKYVLLTSPYNGGSPQDFGFKPIYPLYSGAAISYIKIFEDIAEIRNFLNRQY